MFLIGLNKYKKKMKKLNEKRSILANEYYKIEDKNNCSSCPRYYPGNVKKLEDRFTDCSGCDKITDILSICKKLQAIKNEIDEYIENEYSVEIFKYYSKKDVSIAEKKKGTVLRFDDVFGSSIDGLTKNQKYALVGLLEGDGKYRLS